MKTAKERFLGRILVLAQQLESDELAVLELVAERLVLGRRCYGELDLARDRRNFGREALEEAADMAVYAAAGLLRTSRKSDLIGSEATVEVKDGGRR